MAISKPAAEKILVAKSTFIKQHPFYAALLLSIPTKPVEDGTCPRAFTDGTMIGYNPTWVETLTQDEVTGVLAHEVMHIALMHMFRQSWRLPDAWNIACDFVINENLVKQGFKLPKEALREPKALDKSAEEMYEQAKIKFQQIGASGADSSNFGDCRPHPATGKGKDGKQEGQGESADAASAAQAEAEMKIRIIEAAHAAKMAGKLPAGMERYVNELVEPKVDWKHELRRFFSDVSRDDYSWHRPNRRFVHRGVYLPSLFSEGLGDIVLGVDTSGSIGQTELSAFISEIRKIVEDCSMKNIYLISCDSRAYEPAIYTRESFPDDVKSFKKVLKGGGGTAFEPVFRKVEELGVMPSCLIYLTDLCGSDFGPEPEYPTLWVTTHATEAPWGEVIKIKLDV